MCIGLFILAQANTTTNSQSVDSSIMELGNLAGRHILTNIDFINLSAWQMRMGIL
jgi:hypothetical protein